ncbi:unnamed protein product [Rotaria socialis]|uniref:Uncharacterized protein n=1 Tax=Rotaria socialis TaxID=392032 RepID=A0A821QMX5_9BILA|nr:unnamed protein product [Rotaria socialis]
MHAFVRKHEPEFYKNTYITYKYNIQRADSFRNVVLYHLGGIYIDMDSGCNRPFKDLLATLEALDPDSPHLLAFPTDDGFGFLIDFIVSTAGHPFHKQLISRLHLFNYNFLFHYLTVYMSAGPLYVIIQERLFKSSEQQAVRILTSTVTDCFVWRGEGLNCLKLKSAKFSKLVHKHVKEVSDKFEFFLERFVSSMVPFVECSIPDRT